MTLERGAPGQTYLETPNTSPFCTRKLLGNRYCTNKGSMKSLNCLRIVHMTTGELSEHCLDFRLQHTRLNGLYIHMPLSLFTNLSSATLILKARPNTEKEKGVSRP